MDYGRRRNRVFDFVKKAYEMVDDPSTDSIVSWGPDGRSFIVWKPRECARDLLTKHLQIPSFGRFKGYGFRKIVSGEEHLEFACNDFVRGKPEFLERIGERFVAHMQAFHDRKYKPFKDRLKNCKNREEVELVIKEKKKMLEKENRERMEAVELAMATKLLRAKRLEDQMQHLQAYFLVLDDMMENLVTRPGQPCWFKKPQVGMIAINDEFYLAITSTGFSRSTSVECRPP